MNVNEDSSSPYNTNINVATIAIITNVNTDCRWSTTDAIYSFMSNTCQGSMIQNHNCITGTLTDGTHNFYVSCIDGSANENDDTNNLNVNNVIVDTTPPLILYYEPFIGTSVPETFTIIPINLNENGDCRASLQDKGYNDMGSGSFYDCIGDGTTFIITCTIGPVAPGVVWLSVACKDTSNNADTSASNTDLMYGYVPSCGNWAIEVGESCDDGNTAKGDGCSNICQKESGWICTGEPSVCRKTQCNNLIDDDSDLAIDFPADQQCSSIQDDSEISFDD